MPRKSFPAFSNKVESVFQFWHCIFIHFKPHSLYGKRPVGARMRQKKLPFPGELLGLVEIGADLIHQRHGNLVVAPAAVDGQRHLVAG